ncbi:LysR family transcriptional regulator [Pseudogemmobacter sonorensis]|uniref:LysR family transcriptional regulator n=1 Tax=Pseudogemmobacter sonorensis TaxID=2989681 RepID=UPI0036CAC549
MSRIDLMRAFVALGEIGSYRAAAERLGITQPTLTKQIVRLEDILGRQLFLRSRQGTELTEFGRAYLSEVQPLIHEADRVWDLGLRMASGDTGRLAIGFTFSALEVMSHALLAFRQTYPGVELTFDDISSQSQLPMLRENRLDIALARWPGPGDLASRLVARDRLALAYPAELAGVITSIDSPALRSQPFIRLKQAIAPGFEGVVQRFLDWKGITPGSTHRVNESLVQLRMVEAGFGVALMHASSVARIIDPARIVVREIPSPPQGPVLDWQTGLYWRRDDRDPVVKAFLRIAREAIPALPEG